jgi:uncharacterized membrane protein YraQ (UPF0718 family)/copper chaperone CopZ
MTERLIEIIREFWVILSEMSPYLLFGFIMAGSLYVLIPTSFVERHLGGRGLLASIKASAFGVPLPLCSCGVIPVAASLRRSGASRAATTAFLLSTPQTGVDSILVTYSLLGLIFAIFRPVAAFINGILGGWLVQALVSDVDGEDKPVPPVEIGCSVDSCTCGGKTHVGKEHKFIRAVKYGFIELPRDIGKALVIGLVIAVVISVLVPENALSHYVGQGIFGMLLMMAIGIPLYVCATASVPIAAAFIAAGFSPGAALVFLMTGPATNAATVAVIWKTMGRKTAFIYLGTVAISALIFGYILDLIYIKTGVSPNAPMGTMLPEWFRSLCSVLLLAILVYSFISKPEIHEMESSMDSEKLNLKVTGMHCSHCSTAVRKALLSSPGVEDASVDHTTGNVVIVGKNFDLDAIKKSIAELGYKVEE